MSLLFAAFGASYLYVALKAFQQLSVAAMRYKWIVPVSMFMAVCEVFIVVQSVQQGLGWVVLAIGLGSGFGCMSAMWIHNRIAS